MRTTLDLDEALLNEARALAARRHTTLEAIVEDALQRALLSAPEPENPDPDRFEFGPMGFLVLKRDAGETLTLEQIEKIQRDLDEEDLRKAILPRGA